MNHIRVLLCVAMVLPAVLVWDAVAEVPEEPVQIAHEPQFLFDAYIVDNHWPLKKNDESVRPVFHHPTKHEANPLIPSDAGFASVVRDEQTGRFHMFYQVYDASEKYKYATAYATSEDGVQWQLPDLNMHTWQGDTSNNIVWKGVRDKVGRGAAFLDVPENMRKGYEYVILYRSIDGLHVIGADDPLHWDKASDQHLTELHSDTFNSLVYDDRREEFVLFCRAKSLYLVNSQDPVIDAGESRRVARMASPELWTEWTAQPQNILLPDAADIDAGFARLYGMPVQRYAGIYWGFLWPFRGNDDIHTELVTSRDGLNWQRRADRPKLLELGPEGAWDDGMLFVCAPWVEMDDEWWLYYMGSDGPHRSKDRHAGIGLATIRKEGFHSLRGPQSGGVVVTRSLVWPGGDLLVNADASEGELKVRVSDAQRNPISGFDYEQCQPFTGDAVRHRIQWGTGSLDDLRGQVIRLEFYLQQADLFTFVAEGS